MAQASPQLREIPLSQVTTLSPSAPTIKLDDDVEKWRKSKSYADYAIFLRRLNESVVGYFLPWDSSRPSKAVDSLIKLLVTLDKWIDEIPPSQSPQRFGNLAFRTWGKRLEEKADQVLEALLGDDFAVAIPLLKPLLLVSFGSFTRIDYGTGHETSFALFLLCLTLIRFLEPVVEEERAIVLRVFVRYMHLCWKLQDTYRLEPAGSHGVWGLDDYSLLSYIFGSGQLRDQNSISVSAVLNIPLPPTNLYFMSIMRIHQVKYGPFHEHSSQLYSIATGVPNWAKVNSGLFKMYDAEVLNNRVVVQHIPLGGILEWQVADNTRLTSELPTRVNPGLDHAQTSTPSHGRNMLGEPIELEFFVQIKLFMWLCILGFSRMWR
ncbi:hypothetical protein APHAL10511_000787 [Amanita phalloides]|nr:hypothetical protein APHAL10511_000787 [Amanita phalloides]